jgi:hypothetical protein
VLRILASVVLEASMAAAAAEAAAPSLSVTPKTVERGHVVAIEGSADGCPVADRVTLISRAFRHTHDFAGLPAVFAIVGASGSFRTTTRIPSGKKPGRYAVTARCGGGNLGVSTRLRVLA